MPEYKLKSIHNKKNKKITFYNKGKVIAERHYDTENMGDIDGDNWFEDSMLDTLIEAQLRIFKKDPKRTKIKIKIY